jgi:RNA polymerase sigma factor (sigma-70 family)
LKRQISSRKREVLARIRKNSEDQDAWSDLYVEFWPVVFASCYHLLHGNTEQSRELSHEVFVRLARYRPFAKIDSVEYFHRYLTKSCYNVVRDFYRRTNRQVYVSLEFTATLSAPDTASARELSESVRWALRVLDGPERKLLSLLIDDAPAPEIAKRLSISYSNVRVRIYRLRAKLRRVVYELEAQL